MTRMFELVSVGHLRESVVIWANENFFQVNWKPEQHVTAAFRLPNASRIVPPGLFVGTKSERCVLRSAVVERPSQEGCFLLLKYFFVCLFDLVFSYWAYNKQKYYFCLMFPLWTHQGFKIHKSWIYNLRTVIYLQPIFRFNHLLLHMENATKEPS